MRIEGHAHPLLRAGKDAPACLSSSSTHDALTWVLDGGGVAARTCAVEGPAGSGKATAAALSARDKQAPRRLNAEDKCLFDAVVWIECDATSRPSNVAVLQHFLMRLLLRLVPELRKRSENDGLEFAPPTTVQEGTVLLRKMLAEARVGYEAAPHGHRFCFVLNEVNSPFLPRELGLMPGEAVLALTSSRAVSQTCMRFVTMDPLERSDIHLIFEAYDDQLDILNIVREQTHDELAQVESNRILDEYKRGIEKKTSQTVPLSKAGMHRAQLERVQVLCAMCDSAVTATVAAGVFRRANRWEKRASSETHLADFLRRVERRVEQVVHDKALQSRQQHTARVHREDTGTAAAVARHDKDKRPIFAIPDGVVISTQYIIRGAIESLPLAVKLCLEDLSYVTGDPKTFPKHLAILLWGQRFEQGRPMTKVCNLRSFLEFLQLEEFSEKLMANGLNLQMCMSASKGIAESVGKVVAIISDSELSPHATWKLKQGIFRNCDLDDFMRDHKLFGRFPTAFNVLTQLVDACLLTYDRVSQSLCIHTEVRRALLERARGDWTQRQKDRCAATDLLLAADPAASGGGMLTGKAAMRAAHSRILRCLRNAVCKPGSMWVPKTNVDLPSVQSYFFANIRRHLLGANRAREADALWFNFPFLLQWLRGAGIVEVCAAAARSTLNDGRLRNIVSALQSSAHALAHHPEHFAAQLIARLNREALPPSATNDLGGELLRNAKAHAKSTRALCAVSSSLGSIRERLRSKNIVRNLCGIGKSKDPTSLATAFRPADRAPLVVGVCEALSAIHRAPLVAVVVEMNSGAVEYEVPLDNASAVPRGGMSKHATFLVTSHRSGFLIVWELEAGRKEDGGFGEDVLGETGSHFHFVLGLQGGHTQHVTCVAFNNTFMHATHPQTIRPSRCATAGHDGEVIVWDLSAGIADKHGDRLLLRRTGLWGIVDDLVWGHGGGTGNEEEIVFLSQNRIMVWLIDRDLVRSFKLPGDDVGTRLIIKQRSNVILGCLSGRMLSMESKGTNEKGNTMVTDAQRFGDAASTHTGAIIGLVSGEKNICFSASNDDSSIRVWDALTRACVHKVSLSHIAFIGLVSAESILVGLTDQDAIVMDLSHPPNPAMRNDGGEEITLSPIKGHGGNPITCVALAPSCNFAASGDVRGRVCLWCARTGKLLDFPAPSQHEDPWKEITALAISKTGRQILVGATYRIGSTATHRPVLTLFRFDGIRTTCLMVNNDFSPEGEVHALTFCDVANVQYALSASSDFQVRLWHVGLGRRGQLAMRYTAQPQRIQSLGTTHGGGRVFARGCDGSFSCWQRSTGLVLEKKTGGSTKFKAHAVRFTKQDEPGKGSALILDSSGRISSWDYADQDTWEADVRDSFSDGVFAAVSCLSSTAQSKRFLVYAKHKQVYRLQFHTAKNKKSQFTAQHRLYLKGMSDTVSALAVSDDGNVIVCGSHDGEILCWDLASNINNKSRGNSDSNSDDGGDSTPAHDPAGAGPHTVITRHRTLRTVDRESNSTVQAISLSHDGKIAAIVTWDEVLAIRLSDREVLGTKQIEAFVSHLKYLRNGSILLVADDALRLWQLHQERELLAKQKAENDAKRQWGKVEISAKSRMRQYDSFNHAFSPKMSDECTALAINEPAQDVFAVGFADGSVATWRRNATQVFSTFLVPGGLPVAALDISSDGGNVLVCGKVMCYIFDVGGKQILHKITMKKWIPRNTSLAVVLRPDAVEVVCSEPGTEESRELFYVDRGDRVDAKAVRNLKKEDAEACGKRMKAEEEHGPVVVLGTSQGRVHILRRGGAIPAVPNVLEVPPPPKVKVPIDLTLDGLLSEAVDRRDPASTSSVYALDIGVGVMADIMGEGEEDDAERSSVDVQPTNGWERAVLRWKYQKIAMLRNFGMTIWPYNHNFPGVSKVMEPDRYRKLQKHIAKRNLRCVVIGSLAVQAVVLSMLVLLTLVSMLYLQPPVRVISSKPMRVGLLQVDTVRRYFNLDYEPFIPCTPPESIPNATELWRLGNATPGFNLCNATVKEKALECDDVPPTEGENCIQFRMFGKCGKDWMVGYCCEACFQCAVGCGK
jgi:WD40 repeat protein